MITINIRYKGANGSARAFAKEMTASGTVDAIRSEPGNIRYAYYMPLDDPETILLIDSWADQAAIDAHNASAHFQRIVPQFAALTEERLPVEFFTELES